MTDEQLRAMVREAVARELSRARPAPLRPDMSFGAGPVGAPSEASFGARSGAPSEALSGVMSMAAVHQHVSHAMFAVTAGAEVGGECVIEPAVPCNHCGYCKSFGY